VACSNRQENVEQTPTRGEERIVVDESLMPIVDDQLTVFNMSYPDAHISMIYKPEVGALNTFLSDTVKMAILSRKLTEEEEKHFRSEGIAVRSTRFAIDGVALIVHKSSADTNLLVSDVTDVLQGKKGRISQLVFDNANSSTVRYLKDLSKVSELPSYGVYALQSNQDVIRYVVEHPGVIGVVGMNWIEQPDSLQESLVSEVNYVAIRNLPGKPGSDRYYTPSQTTLALKQYPLLRELYIINCSGKSGAGSGFAAFIAGERGQRLVLLSGLLPERLPSREILIRKQPVN
jgi:phosphate transport system substrate-binding protein